MAENDRDIGIAGSVRSAVDIAHKDRNLPLDKPRSKRTEQVHLRMQPRDVDSLRALARRRGQTLSGAVGYLVTKEIRLHKSND